MKQLYELKEQTMDSTTTLFISNNYEEIKVLLNFLEEYDYYNTSIRYYIKEIGPKYKTIKEFISDWEDIIMYSDKTKAITDIKNLTLNK